MSTHTGSRSLDYLTHCGHATHEHWSLAEARRCVEADLHPQPQPQPSARRPMR